MPLPQSTVIATKSTVTVSLFPVPSVTPIGVGSNVVPMPSSVCIFSSALTAVSRLALSWKMKSTAVRAKSSVLGVTGVVPLVVGGVAVEVGAAVAEATGAGPPPMPLEFGSAKTMSFEVWAEARPRRTGVEGPFVEGLGWRRAASRARGRRAGSGICSETGWVERERARRCDFWLNDIREFSWLQDRLKLLRRETRIAGTRGRE